MKLLFFIYLLSQTLFVKRFSSFLQLDDYMLMVLGIASFYLFFRLARKEGESLIYQITLFCLTVGYFLKYLISKLFEKTNLFEPRFYSLANDPDLNIKAWTSINLALFSLFLSFVFCKFIFKRNKDSLKKEKYGMNKLKAKFLLLLLLASQIFFGLIEVTLGIGVLGLQTHLSWGIAGFVFYIRMIAIPLLLYSILNLSITNNDKQLQMMTLGELFLLGLSQMFISSSRSSFLWVLLPAVGLYYFHGQLKKKQILVISLFLLLVIIALQPIITRSRFFRYDYGASRLMDSLGNFDEILNYDNYSDALLFPLARFTGYDSLLYSINGTTVGKSLLESIKIVFGDYDSYFTYQVVGYNDLDETFKMAPGLIGAAYSLGGQTFVVLGCFAFFLFWFSILKLFSKLDFASRLAIYFFLLFQYMAFLSEGYIEMNRYIKFSLIFFVVFIVNEKILAKLVIKNWPKRHPEGS